MSKFNGLGIPFFGCAMLLVTNIFFVLAFASPFWLTFDGSPDHSRGLWRKRRCLVEGTCYQFDIVGTIETYLDAVRGLMCLAIIFLPIPLVVVPIYLYVASLIYYRRIMATSAIFCLIAAICTFLSVIIYGIKASREDYSLGWSFFLAVFSCVSAFVSFTIFLVATLVERPISGQLLSNAIYVENLEQKSYISEKPFQ